MMLSAPQASSRALYFRLLGYLRPYWKVFALATLGMVGTAATEPVFPAIMKYLLDRGFQTDNTQLIWLIPAGIVVLFMVRGVLSFCTSYLMTWISTRLIIDLRRQLFDKILKLPTHIFQEQSAGKLISRLVYDTDNLNQAATNVLVTAVRETLTALALFFYLLYLDWQLTLITLAIGPMMALTIKSFSRRIRAASRASFEAIRAMAHTIEESTDAHKVIKIFGGQEQQRQRFFNDTERFRRSMMREAVPAAALTPITHLVASLAVATITFLALSQTTGGASASAGGFFITAMLLLIAPIKSLAELGTPLMRGLVGLERGQALIDDIPDEQGGGHAVPRAQGEIRLEAVTVRYKEGLPPALDQVSLQLRAGETLALVGNSGSGKTTLAQLLPRLIECTEGRVLLDGQDITRWDLASLRAQFAYVSQHVVMLNDSLAVNVALGQEPDRARVLQCLRDANLESLALALPQGMDTLLGHNAMQLSGGQRQRLAIARALYKDAPILILDEATSALDGESERAVQQAIERVCAGRTALVVAHRMSTIEHADCIVVLEAGRVIETGSHAQLMASGGHYSHLYRLGFESHR